MNLRFGSCVTGIPFQLICLALTVSGCGGGSNANLIAPGKSRGGEMKFPAQTATNARPTGDGTADLLSCDESGAQAFPPLIRALTGTQYANTLRAFSGQANFEAPFQQYVGRGGFSSNARVLMLDEDNTHVVFNNAELVARAQAPVLLKAHDCLNAGDAACVDSFVGKNASSLFRRPATSQEIAFYRGVFTTTKANLGTVDAVSMTIRVMLSSPAFLFRSELGVADSASGRRTLDSYELASAISYLTTDAPPDSLLMEDARQGRLSTADEVAKHVTRLLESDLSSPNGAETMISELLGYGGVLTVPKNETSFPGFSASVRTALARDTDDFVRFVVRKERGSLKALLSSSTIKVRKESASIYGLDPSTLGSGVSTTTVNGRRGILMQPSWLASNGNDSETNPVRRGHEVLSKFLCVSVPPPPKDIPPFPEFDPKAKTTVRERVEKFHAVGACKACHERMDNLGFPFEGFDTIGRARTSDQGLALNLSGAIVGSGSSDGAVSGADALVERLSGSKDAAACFARHAAVFVTGLDDGPSTCAAARLMQAGQEPSLNSYIVSLLSSSEFRNR